MEGDFQWPNLGVHGNTWVLRNVSKGKVKIFFFLIKLAMIKMDNPFLERSVFISGSRLLLMLVQHMNM